MDGESHERCGKRVVDCLGIELCRFLNERLPKLVTRIGGLVREDQLSLRNATGWMRWHQVVGLDLAALLRVLDLVV